MSETDNLKHLLTGPLRAIQTAKFSGQETLKLDRNIPKNTSRLSFHHGENIIFDKEEDAWVINRSGHLKIELEVPQKQGLVFIPDLRRVSSGPDDDILKIDLNGYEWKESIDSRNLNFHKQSWYLPHYKMVAGSNVISIGVRRDAGTNVMLKSVSVMRFELEQQRKENWCWAAVTASITNYLNDEKSISQCEVVNHCFGMHLAAGKAPDCCKNEDSKKCDLPFSLTDALEAMGMRVSRSNYPLSLDELKEQIVSGLPIAVRIGWSGVDGGAHFIVITAVGPDHPDGDDSTWIRVADPYEKAASYIPFGKLRDNYRGDGRWTHTYLVRR
ncbi:MAG: hypothetical protein IPJ07_22715 [Acidobacteria bacterium]|nr:hypothetical protein [Acidobacteriota bacterium]